MGPAGTLVVSTRARLPDGETLCFVRLPTASFDTNGTPVENMLAHSTHLPLTVDYIGRDGITADDEVGILLALEQRHRVSHIRLFFPDRILQKLVMEIDEEFPILEYLIVEPQTRDSTVLMLPEAPQSPNLRHLMLFSFACPIRPWLYPTAASLVTFCLVIDHQSAYFHQIYGRYGFHFYPS